MVSMISRFRVLAQSIPAPAAPQSETSKANPAPTGHTPAALDPLAKPKAAAPLPLPVRPSQVSEDEMRVLLMNVSMP